MHPTCAKWTIYLHFHELVLLNFSAEIIVKLLNILFCNLQIIILKKIAYNCISMFWCSLASSVVNIKEFVTIVLLHKLRAY